MAKSGRGGMARRVYLVAMAVAMLVLVRNGDARILQPAAAEYEFPTGSLRPSDFPDGFVFGSSSSAYQYEGAVAEGGRGPSVWDTYSHEPGAVADNSTGDRAVDQYHRYLGDVELMADLGMDAYRFSISWSRIFPDASGKVNPEGVAYYNRLIDALVAQGIQPWATLYHWDPVTFRPYFAAYAEVCFAAFGDRVKRWATFNEIHHNAYVFPNVGCRAPSGLCGDVETQPYVITHHMLLSHAKAVEVYRTKFQARQGGAIGLLLDVQWFEPISESQEDIDAADRILAFSIQWLMDPLVHGHYPAVMRNLLQGRLPALTEPDATALKGSFDFIGLNHYTTHWTQNCLIPRGPSHYGSELDDSQVALFATKNGVPIGPQAGSTWLEIVPWGMGKLLNHIKVLYNNPLIYITENGVDESDEAGVSVESILQDDFRTKYYHDYLTYVIGALRNGSNIAGYFAWSLLDNFEWRDGLSKRFGLYYVDYKNDFARRPKSSVKWFKELLRHGPQEGQPRSAS